MDRQTPVKTLPSLAVGNKEDETEYGKDLDFMSRQRSNNGFLFLFLRVVNSREIHPFRKL